EGRIVVRRARPGERMATLDGVGRELDPAMLVIADARQPVAVAGVMGGAGSEIRATTRTVLLESACFQPAQIRATARRLGLATESSSRFERGVDLAGVDWASRRAAALLVELAGAQAARGVLDVGAARPAPRVIRCRYDVIRARIGVEISNEKIRAIFQSLELTVPGSETSAVGGAGSPAHEEAAGGVCDVTIPSFRPDLEREVDLVEEVARIHGLDRIPAPTPHAQLVVGADDRATQAQTLCRQHLVGLGLREIMNYSFVAAPLLDLFEPAAAPRRLVLPHPVSQEEAVLRNALAPQMAATLGRNHARQIPEAALFEIGRVFLRDAQGRPAEEERLAIGLTGAVDRGGLDRRRPPTAEETFLGLKGLWDALLQALGIRAWTCRAAPCPYGEEGWSVALGVDDQIVGTLCLLRGGLAREWRLTAPVGLLESRLAPLLRHVFKRRTIVATAPYPAIRRDMALIVSQTLQHEEIVQRIRHVAPPELENVELFDIFEDVSLGAGRKSMAYACTYRASDRTLTDAEANAYHEQVKAAVKAGLHVEVRQG
ncbi:MAG: phenylalanine--tRNA ligase subunit beta, partial [Kiritimatiellaeota bacterium]|nr:phenylalanine--tRNA ligase subunit beta [Kiritimatiellota bacterium]